MAGTTTWVRVYANPLRPFMRALGLLWVVGPCGVLVGGLTRLGGLRAVGLGAVLVPAAGYAGYRIARVLWRVTAVGVFVSDLGVKVVNPAETVVPWAQVARVELRPPTRSGGGLWSTGQVLWIVRTDGTAVQTRLSQGPPLTLTGRRAYARAVRTLDGMIDARADRSRLPAPD